MKGIQKLGIIVVMLLALFLIAMPVFAPSGYIIDGDKIFINDSNAFLSASPHTISSGGWVTFELQSKTYTGNIDALWGFNSSNALPDKAELYNPHNITETNTYKCERPQFYNYTLNPNYVWSWRNITTTSNETNITTNETLLFETNKTILVFETAFDRYNLDSYEVYQDYTVTKEWTDVSDKFASETQNFQGFDKWYYITDVPVVAGQIYTLRANINAKMNTSGKYFFATKPSGETLQQAITNNHFYYIDPWWNASLTKRMNDTITANETFTNFVYLLNSTTKNGCGFRHAECVSAGGCQADGDDIRMVDADDSIALSYDFENGTVNTNTACVWVKDTIANADKNKLYHNSSTAVNGESSSTWSGYGARFPFQEGSGTLTNDSSPNNNKGILYGITFTTGKFGYGLNFNGLNTYANISWSSSLNFTSAFTYEFWLYPTTGTTGYLFDRRDGATFGTLFIASAIFSPICLSPFAEIVPTCAIS